jgi:GTP cyclohydrolase I
MTARGIKKPGVKTKTASCGGQFLVNAELRKEFYLVDSK